MDRPAHPEFVTPVKKRLPPAPLGKTGWPWDGPADEVGRIATEAWPRISIVVPSFNQADYLEETLRAVLLQDYPDLELIVIDGASTDGSVTILERYAPWLAYWESEPDRGQSHAINKGLARATGEVVTFVGSDDLYLPGTLADVARRWAEWRSYGAIVGAFYFIDSDSRLQGEPHAPRLPGPGPHDLSLGIHYRLHQVATFYTRAALDAVGRHVREDLHYTMDRDLLYRVAKRFPILLAERPYGAFRRHDEGKSGASQLAWKREYAKLTLLHQNGDAREDRIRRRVARRLLAVGHVRHAHAMTKRRDRVMSLLWAIRYRPSYLFRSGYLATWLGTFGLKEPVKRLRACWRRG